MTVNSYKNFENIRGKWMERKNYKVTIKNQTIIYPEGTPYGEIVKAYDQGQELPTVLVFANGRLRELHKTLKEDCVLEPVSLGESIGHKAYKRSMTLLLLKAVYHVADHDTIEKVVLHYSVGSGFYYTIEGTVVLDETFLEKVKAYMLELVEREIPIMKRSVSTNEARELFANHGMKNKEKLFRYRRSSRVNIYSLADFEDYFYGFMVWHTGYLKYFDLQLYDEGFVLLMPERAKPTVIPPFQPSPKIFKVQQRSEKWGMNVSAKAESKS